MNLEKAKKLIEKCNYLGVYVFGCFVIGFPEETKEQIGQTVNFIINSGLDYAKISILQPFPGTDVYKVYEKLGFLKDGIKQGSTYFHTEYDTVHLRANELNSLRCKTLKKFGKQRILNMLSFYGLKRYLFPKLNSFENVCYFVRMLWQVMRGL